MSETSAKLSDRLQAYADRDCCAFHLYTHEEVNLLHEAIAFIEKHESESDAEWTVSNKAIVCAIDECQRRYINGLTPRDLRDIIESAVAQMRREHEERSA